MIIDNPFPYECVTTAQVNYDNYWQDTLWNDQIGVRAMPLPNDVSKINVQVGLLGWLAYPKSAGTSFKNEYTITTPLQTRVICRRVF
jgi:hypothetical protein